MRNLLFWILLLNVPSIHAQQLFRFEKNGKYGFKDASNNVIVKPIYESASYTITSLGGVSNKDGWAVINNQGRVLTGFNYNGGVGDAKGFDLIPVYTGSGFMGVNHHFGIVNKDGVEIAPTNYTFVEIVSNDLAIISNYESYGLINKSGKLVLPMDYTKETLRIFTNIQPNGIYLKNGEWKAFSFDGDGIKKWKYDNIVVEGEKIWPVKLANKWGFVDSTGREIVKPTYDRVGLFASGVAVVMNGEKMGVINKYGTLIIPPLYDSIRTDKKGNYQICTNSRWGMVNNEGKPILQVKYEQIGPFSEDLCQVKLKGKWGYADVTAKEVIPAIYDNVLPFSDGLAAVVLNNKIGFISKTGTLVIEPQFDDLVEPFYKGKAIVVKDNKEIYIDKKGIEIK